VTPTEAVEQVAVEQVAVERDAVRPGALGGTLIIGNNRGRCCVENLCTRK
jgi:hypothetical protein